MIRLQYSYYDRSAVGPILKFGSKSHLLPKFSCLRSSLIFMLPAVFSSTSLFCVQIRAILDEKQSDWTKKK